MILDRTTGAGRVVSHYGPPLAKLPIAPDLKRWATRVVEKVRTASISGRLRFAPYLDDIAGGETAEHRRAYREMVREPTLKAALHTKVLAVASLDVQVHPADKNNHRDQEAATGFAEQLRSRRIKGGTRKIAWNILTHGLMDGWSLCEPKWHPEPERYGPFVGKRFWSDLKAKDTADLEPEVDEFGNVVCIKGGPFNPGQHFDPADFVIWSHAPFFENPRGLSDFRASYRAYWIKDTVMKLWALHLDKFVGPFLKGTYTSDDQKDALETALEDARARSWVSVPTGALVEAVSLSTGATAEYDLALDRCDREMLIGTLGSYLQVLEGKVSDGRGDTSIHKEISELFQWMLAAELGDVVSEQMAAEWTALNYANAQPPTVTFGAVNEGDLEASARVDKALQEIGLKLSKRSTYEKYGRQEPTDEADVLVSPLTQPAAPAPGAGFAATPPTAPVPSLPAAGGPAAEPFCERGTRKPGASWGRPLSDDD